MNLKIALPLILVCTISDSFAEGTAESLTKIVECHSIRGAQESISLRASMNGDNEDNSAVASLVINHARGAISKDTPCNDENFSIATNFATRDFSVEADISTDDTTSMSVKVEALPETLQFSESANAENGIATFDAKLTGDISKFKGTPVSVSEVPVKCTATWKPIEK